MKPILFIPTPPIDTTAAAIPAVVPGVELELESEAEWGSDRASHSLSNYNQISKYNRTVFNNYLKFEYDLLCCGCKTGSSGSPSGSRPGIMGLMGQDRPGIMGPMGPMGPVDGYMARGLNVFDTHQHAVSNTASM